MCVQGVGGRGAHFLTKCFVHVCKLFIHLVVVHIILGKWGWAFSHLLGTFCVVLLGSIFLIYYTFG